MTCDIDYYTTMHTLFIFCLFFVAGGGSCNNGAMDTSNDSTDENKKDENEMLDWRIYPTSVKATSKDPLDLNNAAGSVDISGISGSNAEISGSSQQFLSRTEREDVDLGKDYYIDGQNTQLIFF